MKYQKLAKDNYNLHIINTDKFKTINIIVNFKRKIKKEEITKRVLLNGLLINTSKNYKTPRDIEIKTEDLYNLGIKTAPYKTGNYHVMSFKETFLNEKYTEKGMNKKSIEFLLDLIFNPNVKQNKFDSTYFNLIKNSVLDDIKGIKDNTTKYSLVRLYEEMDNGPFSFRSNGYLNDLKKIDEKNLYEYYKKVIDEDQIDIFIVGDIDSKIEKIFDKYIKGNHPIKNDLSHELELKEIDKSKTLVTESIKTNQSKLAIGLRINDIDEFDIRYTSYIYSIILGGSPNSRLFQTVREKNSLCYYINSSILLLSKTITIQAGINKENYEKTIALIQKELNNMTKNITDEEIEVAKKMYINSCIEINDSPASILSHYISHEYGNFDLLDDRIKNIQKVTKDMVLNLASKIELDKIFLLEGVLNDEKDTIK